MESLHDWAIMLETQHCLLVVWYIGSGVDHGNILRDTPVWDVIFQSGDSLLEKL